MATTYTPIYTYTLGTATNIVDFTSIPSTYTDLVLVCNFSQNGDMLQGRFNSSAVANYSCTNLYGTGGSAGSNRRSNFTEMRLSQENYNADNTWCNVIINVMDYANTASYKTVLSRSNVASQEVNVRANLWRITPEAINAIRLFGATGNNFAVGSTFTLYGIKAA